MTTIAPAPPAEPVETEGAARRYWRVIPTSWDGLLANWPEPYDHTAPSWPYRLYETLEDAAAVRPVGYAGVVVLVRCDEQGTPLTVDGVQSQYPCEGFPKIVRAWAERHGVACPEPLHDYSGYEVLVYEPQIVEKPQPTGHYWREPPGFQPQHGGSW